MPKRHQRKQHLDSVKRHSFCHLGRGGRPDEVLLVGVHQDWHSLQLLFAQQLLQRGGRWTGMRESDHLQLLLRLVKALGVGGVDDIDEDVRVVKIVPPVRPHSCVVPAHIEPCLTWSCAGHQCPKHWAWTPPSGRTWCWILVWGWSCWCLRWRESWGLSSCRRCRDQAVKSSAPGRGRLSAFWETQCNKFCRKRSEKEVDARTDNDLQIETLTFAHRSIDHPSNQWVLTIRVLLVFITWVLRAGPFCCRSVELLKKKEIFFSKLGKHWKERDGAKYSKNHFKEAGYCHHLKQVREPVRRAESWKEKVSKSSSSSRSSRTKVDVGSVRRQPGDHRPTFPQVAGRSTEEHGGHFPPSQIKRQFRVWAKREKVGGRNIVWKNHSPIYTLNVALWTNLTHTGTQSIMINSHPLLAFQIGFFLPETWSFHLDNVLGICGSDTKDYFLFQPQHKLPLWITTQCN